MEITMHYRHQSAEELAAWNAWICFTEQAMVAPDCPRDAEWLAARYMRETGERITAAEVKALMPENHPNYPWDQA